MINGSSGGRNATQKSKRLMKTFIYKARDKYGELLSAAIDVENEMQAASSLRAMGYSVISIEEKKRFMPQGLADFWQKFRKAHLHELVFFSRQLSALLKSGIPITAAISSINEQVRSKVLKQALSAVLKDIEAGASFSVALAKYPAIFSEVFVSMVGAGEAGGNTAEVLDRLARLSSREFEIKLRVKSAMTYPVILVVVALVIVNFLLVSIVPKFIVIFRSYEVSLPLPTQILLAVSFIVSRLWFLALAAVITVIIAGRAYLKTEKGRYRADNFLLHMPLFSGLYSNIIVSRMCRTLGEMVKSGVPILEALYVTSKTISNTVIRRVVENVRLAISEGKPLGESFKASGVFPQTVIQMVAMGEKSGRLDQMLIDVASFYDEEVDYAIKNITTALEPLLLLGMGSMVAFIALSVLLPIFNLVKIFKR